MIIGERARQAIVERATAEGKNAIAYAEEIGISKVSFNNWLKKCEPRAYSLSLMAEAGLDVHWILTGKRGDKVEVVRCKDCASYGTDGCADGFGWCALHDRGKTDFDFCSCGGRMGYNATD